MTRFRTILGNVARKIDEAPTRQEAGRFDWFYSFMAAVICPFKKSIRSRFQFALALSLIGFTLMAGITIFSGFLILNSYEESVAEAQEEMIPVSLLQVSLRELDHAAYRHAIEGELTAAAEFQELRMHVSENLNRMLLVEQNFSDFNHAHSEISITKLIETWQESQAVIAKVFQQPAGSPEATLAMSTVHKSIDPIYDVVSAYHHKLMQDLVIRLMIARTVGGRAFMAVIAAIVAGLAILSLVSLVVSRSILHPLAQLQVAAHKLGEKDLSYRVKLDNEKDELGELAASFNMASATLQQLYAELEKRSTHDGLTGILNRAAFDERLAQEIKSADRHARSLSLLMVDIDFFKKINDTYGHPAGDQVLRDIVSKLSATMRTGDIIARYGGEEFAIILRDMNEIGAAQMAERLREAVEHTSITHTNGKDIRVTVSMGCTSRRPNSLSPIDLVKITDEALYRAKATGRNCVVSATPSSTTNGTSQHSSAA